MDKGQLCLAAIYQNDTWDHYWEGTLKRDNQNVGTLTRQTVLPMFALGISNKINVLAALPWVSTDASAGQVRGANGIQDLGIWLKGELFNFKVGTGKFSAHAVGGLTLPASNYLADYAPFSLGLGCPDGSLRGIFQYQFDNGIYLRTQAGFHVRGTTKIERDYYYTTYGIYSDKVDMPNAATYGTTAGIWLFDYSLKLELFHEGMNTLGGHDIRRQDVGFPSNNMDFTRIGGGFHYYTPFLKGLGIVGSANRVLSGRNIGQSTVIMGGISYQFAAWKNHDADNG